MRDKVQHLMLNSLLPDQGLFCKFKFRVLGAAYLDYQDSGQYGYRLTHVQ